VLGTLLGRGGMAEVFAGHAIGDHGFQKPVAIKRLLPELANDEVFVARLIQEAKLLVGMQHGNIVSVLDLARDGEDVFLVMEYVDGPSLRQLLKARGGRGVSLAVASYIVQSAAAGLEFAHARPGGAVIHADISPSNLLLTTSGEVRVADFGIARREGGAHGIVEGKWAYMAPEQARGEPLSPGSDVFALGVVLYELITGRHPFGQRITASEREREPVRVIPPRVVRPSVPPGLDAICMRALAHDPRERYARMQHLIDALVDERFSNQWREGAAELAHAIRECAAPGPVLPPPPTSLREPAVTLVTRSLIELTPARSLAELTPAPQLAVGTSPARVLPDAELAPRPRARRWALAVLALAAMFGVTAAIALHAGSEPIAHAEPPPVTVASAAPDEERGFELPAPARPVEPAAPSPRRDAPAAVPASVATDAAVSAGNVEVEVEVEAEPIARDRHVSEATAPAPRTPRRTEKPTPHAAAKKKEPGTLRVSAFPWAWVQVDGGPRRDALGARFSLSPGRHTVKLFNDDGAKKTRTIVISSGKTTTVRVNFEDDTLEVLD